ncbi:hypothetical protein [Streptomyces sp. NPDC093600]|uniref:hypothetical protein n=1 Tax=Streptomyces sp. NPDC093600 TaxID=3366047 RepID=UPI0037FB9060
MSRIQAMARRLLPTARRAPDKPPEPRHMRRERNLFEAAAVYVVGSIEDDQEQVDEATSSVAPEALMFGLSELACRAVIALARERNESPQKVARSLLGLPEA